MSKIILGIDPGKSGGISVYGEVIESTPASFFNIDKMPETETDIIDLFNDIASFKTAGVKTFHAYIENVASSPQMGVVSSFTFGYGYGVLIGALLANKIPFTKVRPQSWQKDLKCLSKGDKNVTKRRAQQLFPGYKITHNVADSMLIAYWGYLAS